MFVCLFFFEHLMCYLQIKLNAIQFYQPPYLFQTVTELDHELDDIIRSHGYPVNSFSSFAYDAIWSIALTLDQASYILNSQNKQLSNFTYGDNETAILFRDILRNLSFYGMSVSNYLLCPYFNVLRVPISKIKTDFTR